MARASQDRGLIPDTTFELRAASRQGQHDRGGWILATSLVTVSTKRAQAPKKTARFPGSMGTSAKGAALVGRVVEAGGEFWRMEFVSAF
jgi:hypothetical protein